MKQYDLIVIGTGSVMEIVNAVLQENPHWRVAVIDKDEPGGICLTRGCIPSKILLYPAEVVRTIEKAGILGIDVDVRGVDFGKVMERMRRLISGDISMIRQGLTSTKSVDYYPMCAEFTGPYTLKVGDDTVTSRFIILGAGSKPQIPPIKGLEEAGYLTSDTVLALGRLPESIVVIGGGYIAAEYGHFLSAMGSKVAVIGRNPQFLPDEEPEVSAIAKMELEKHMTILTNHEVREAVKAGNGLKRLVAVNRETGEEVEIEAHEILVASGRSSNSDVLHPERAGIEVDKEGWIVTNEFLETSQPGVWALGDATGKFPFKHKANYDAQMVYYNAVLKRGVKVDYHAVPHAVFTYPEVASVGLREKEAVQQYGEDMVLIGSHRYADTAKGEAMGIEDENYFVKVIVLKDSLRILGAHIVGPHASALIQEVVNLMYTPEQSAQPVLQAMHIHPALSEVVQKAVDALAPPNVYHHVLEHHFGLKVE
ncbi:MAG TPA: dihydrolipoyl dehydrogenase [Candidatus Bathyarchaeia archaeon]|nr:dihydrolipoyl dehydrogenase [Candidatus Bathyarchaeia archaeon]